MSAKKKNQEQTSIHLSIFVTNVLKMDIACPSNKNPKTFQFFVACGQVCSINEEIMEAENNNSIKDDIIIVIKESMKFALVGVTLLLVVGTSLLYIFLKFTRIDMEIAAMLTGIIVAIFIVVADEKKIHSNNKILECNRRIIKKVLKLV